MGEFNYKKEYTNWKWDIPDEYNIGFDCVDKHTLTEKKNRHTNTVITNAFFFIGLTLPNLF